MEKIKCDSCGSERCAKILYGRVIETKQLRKDLAAGKVVLGGCMVSDGMPRWQCLNCGKEWGSIIMNTLSKAIGDGIQTFRIRDFDQHFSIVKDLGPDYANYIDSRKIVQLVDEGILYALVRVFYKDFEEFVIRITTDVNSINWKEIADRTEKCRWRGPELDQRYIN